MISIFMSYEGVFERLDIAAAGSTDFEAMALADLNGDGALNIVGHADDFVYVFWNQFVQGDVVTFRVLGENGEDNQFGRSLRLTPLEQSDLVLARVVDSGSGYLSQGQYDLVVGLPIGGVYNAEVALATGMLRFVISANQQVTTFADGRVAIVGSGDADTMGGANGDDVLTSAGGDDLILGSLGVDAIDGGTGRDIVDFSGMAGGIVADLAAGTALVSGEGQTLAGIEGLIGTSGDDELHGDAASNELTGGDGDDLLDGNAGADILRGGRGNDVYIVDSALDDVAEASGEGDDEVQTSLASYALGASVERLTGTSSGGQSLTGNDTANLIQGGAGADTFTGGLGDYTYIVGDADGVVELADGGYDTVRTHLASYALADNVEDLVGLAVSGQALTDNSLGNHLSGGAGADTFVGAGGDDVYTVGTGDIVVEAPGEGVDEVRTALATYTLTENVEILRGTSNSAQHLFGNASANTIAGGTGRDTFEGGAGDDLYLVGRGDMVVELTGAGIDEVRTELSTYTLTANVENLTGMSNLGQKLVGNDLGNEIRSGGGLDVLIGRGGDDSYWITNTFDSIAEVDGEGFDTVFTTVDFMLQEGVFVEAVAAADAAGTLNLTLTGNSLANQITGNAGANMIFGGGGADVLAGLGGDDRYYIDNLGVSVVEAAAGGNDAVLTSVNFVLAEGTYVETLQTRDSGGTSSIDLTGNSLPNTLIGNAGNNVLDGGAGDDVLNGLGGSDVMNGGNGQDEAHFRGSKSQYTVTAEGAGYRVVDSVAGRDGSTFVNSVETLRFLSDGTTTVLTYGSNAAQPSGSTDEGESSGQAQSGPGAFVSPHAADLPPTHTDAFEGPSVREIRRSPTTRSPGSTACRG
nr:calcium-binding protein [Brevundimonas sp.]